MSARGGTFDARPFGAIAAAITSTKLDRQTKALLQRGDSPRSGEPVWRNSYYVGQIEDRVWKPINGGTARSGKRWTAALLKAAKAFELRTRSERREVEPGARNGALGEVGIAVLEHLYATVDYTTGRLEPAIRTIADAIGRAYSAVHEALCRLRKHGFLHWMRRSQPIKDPVPGGPRVEQASNAYALLVPEGMKGWLARLLGTRKPPACEEDRHRRKREEFEHMLASLSAREYADAFTWNGDRLIGETLRRLAAAVDRRESPKGESGGSDETGGSY
ncbi:conserved hypothetical protein [Altererythrobacter sp. B11]|uniref:hypothetical protein n=1 Tax=Altererythrobacter sp. B11 TaxID=2060312 RepID=UPI000DC6F36C|nr:hypothetical protein [Altererythrobacter sp. B11]BBC72941.1 conserved hypothetical protein [Altererythrobacter sp. B11]